MEEQEGDTEVRTGFSAPGVQALEGKSTSLLYVSGELEKVQFVWRQKERRS